MACRCPLVRAGARPLATVAAERGESVRSTIDPNVQRAAVRALAGRFDASPHANARAVVAQPLAAIEMNWSEPCGKPLSK